MPTHLATTTLATATAAAALSALQPFSPSALCSDAPRPNIILILADDMGYADIGPFGSTKNRTPNLDRMAAEGLRLTSFYAAPLCTPSRAQIMTGCYAKRVSMSNIGNVSPVGLNPKEHTVAKLLKQQGYDTAIIGKWHLGDQPPFLPTKQGFDTYFGLPYSNDMNGGPATKTQKARPPLPLMRDDKPIEVITPEKQTHLEERYTEAALQFIRAHASAAAGASAVHGSQFTVHSSQAADAPQKTSPLELARQRQTVNREPGTVNPGGSAAAPFFLYLAHTAVHFPIHPGPNFAGKSANGRYGDWVEELDWSTGRILDTLRELDIAGNTLVIFTSDNGPALNKKSDGGSAGPLRGGKGGTFEGGMREPFIAWWPGKVPAGLTIDTITGNIDLLPTFVALAGGRVPTDNKIDGADISPILLGKTTESPRKAQFYFENKHALQAVRLGPWKLAIAKQEERTTDDPFVDDPNFAPHLYNLDTDIGERHDLAAQRPDIVAQLQALIAEMDKDLGAKRHGPGMRPNGRVANPVGLWLPAAAAAGASAVHGSQAADETPKAPAPELARQRQTVNREPGTVNPGGSAAAILTPKPPPAPRVNGARIFGVRPGHPFLYTIPATGDRPMTFAADNLPAGLTLDPATGQITGAIAKPGDYPVTLRAKNHLGEAARDFKIVCGDTLGLTPQMGWNSWYVWTRSVTDKIMREAADAMVSTGLINHGYQYICIDDCWAMSPKSNDPALNGPPRDPDGNINPNSHFPDMKALTDYIHAKGLKAGIYTSPGPLTCAGHTGSYGHESADAQRFAEWGFDLLKYDMCSYKPDDPNSRADLQKPYQLMGDLLRAQNRDIIMNICQYGRGNVWEWGKQVGGHSWRTARDLGRNYQTLSTALFADSFDVFARNELHKYGGPGGWNDPDYLLLGYLRVRRGGDTAPTTLTPDEQYTHVSLWCLVAAPLFLSGDITRLDDFTLSLLTNDEMIDVNQDPLGKPARRVAQNGPCEVWMRDLSDGSKAVGLFNRGETETQVTARWPDLGLTGKQIVRDLWRQQDLGTYQNEFGAPVPRHGVVMLRLRAP